MRSAEEAMGHEHPGTCGLIDVCLHIGYFQGGKHLTNLVCS